MQVQLCAPSSGPISSNTCYHMTVGTSTWLSPRKGVLFYNSLLRPAWYHDRRSRRETDRARPPTHAAGSAADPSDARNGAAADSVPRHAGCGYWNPGSVRPCWARISNTHSGTEREPPQRRAPRRRPAGRRRGAARLRRTLYRNQYLSFSGGGRVRGPLLVAPAAGTAPVRRTGSPFQYKYNNSSTI